MGTPTIISLVLKKARILHAVNVVEHPSMKRGHFPRNDELLTGQVAFPQPVILRGRRADLNQGAFRYYADSRHNLYF